MAKAKEKAPSTAPSKKYQFYSGGSKNRKECPKCGKGVFLGQYKNPERLVCGRCGYTEIDGKEVTRESKTIVPEMQAPKEQAQPKQETPKPEVKEELKVEEKKEEAPATSESEDANASDEQAEESEEKKE